VKSIKVYQGHGSVRINHKYIKLNNSPINSYVYVYSVTRIKLGRESCFEDVEHTRLRARENVTRINQVKSGVSCIPDNGRFHAFPV